jgi:hypothetical protein
MTPYAKKLLDSKPAPQPAKSWVASAAARAAARAEAARIAAAIAPVPQKDWKPSAVAILETACRRPLMNLWTAAWLLGVDEDGIVEFIQDGKIQHAFNLARPGRRVRMIRIFSQDVLDFGAGVNYKRDLGAVIASILPAGRDSFRTPEIQYKFHCAQSHLSNLIKAGCFPGQRMAKSKNRLSRASVVQFLTKRRILQ